MPRRRKRATSRKSLDERRLRVRAVRRGSPDAKQLARAFMGLALARAEADAQAQGAGQSAVRQGAGGDVGVTEDGSA